VRGLYLVYRVFADGDRRPESIIAVEDGDFAAACRALEALVDEEHPDFALGRGERWEFVRQDDAPADDWDEVAPFDARNLPY
jgi:hypothetical protein